MNHATAFADTLPAAWGAPDAPIAAAASWVARMSDLLQRWLVASRSRHTLDELDDHLLRDIGLTREQARREADKFFWQA